MLAGPFSASVVTSEDQSESLQACVGSVDLNLQQGESGEAVLLEVE